LELPAVMGIICYVLQKWFCFMMTSRWLVQKERCECACRVFTFPSSLPGVFWAICTWNQSCNSSWKNPLCRVFYVLKKIGNGCSVSTAMSNPNGLLSQKLCHYLDQARTLNCLLRSQQTKFSW